jgi:hypothetical protein
MARPRPAHAHPQTPGRSRGRRRQKKTPTLLKAFFALWEDCTDAFAQDRVGRRACRLALSQLACLGEHTVTGLICAAGRQRQDWSSDYRFFSRRRWQTDALFRPVLGGVLELTAPSRVLVAALDDTLLRKAGARTPGTAWRRDPLSPPFHTNFIRAQRFIQMSALLPTGPQPTAARAIPIHYEHVPPVPKPRKTDGPDVWKTYRRRCRRENLSARGAAVIAQLRTRLDRLPEGRDRLLVVGVDGSYCNGPVLKTLPSRTTLIGRVRKDARLFHPPRPEDQAARGTKRRYGPRAATPEALRQDESVSWQEVRAFAAGRLQTFRVKTVGPLLWPKAGPRLPLRLVVIAPIGYRLRRGSKILYRRPAFLICTDPDHPLQEVVQEYLWRWDIEVNHRDEKQLIGVGEAQVRAPLSVDRDPPFAVASYATLLLAAAQVHGPGATAPALEPPKWRRGRPNVRLTTRDLIQELRQDLWGEGLRYLEEMYSGGFASVPADDTKPSELRLPLTSGLLYSAPG